MIRRLLFLFAFGLGAVPAAGQAALVNALIWDPTLAGGLSGTLQYDTSAAISDPTVEFAAIGEVTTLTGWTFAPVTSLVVDASYFGHKDLTGSLGSTYLATDPDGTAGLLYYNETTGVVDYKLFINYPYILEIYDPSGEYGQYTGITRWMDRNYTVYVIAANSQYDLYHSSYEIETVPLPGGFLLFGSGLLAFLVPRLRV